MSLACPWCFPDPRAVAAWRRAPAPAAAWVAFLRLYHAEVLVEYADVIALGRFEQLVLSAFPAQGNIAQAQLDARLHLGPTLLVQLLRRLADADLIHTREDGVWSITAMGQQAGAQGQQPRRARRGFTFVDRPGLPPHFLALGAAAGLPAEADAFHPRVVADAIRQDADWKQRHGFPADAIAVVTDGPRAVALVHSSWLPVFLEARGDVLMGCSFSPDSTLGSSPQLELGEDWRDVLPQLQQSWSIDQARQAWGDWCRCVDVREVEATEVILVEGRLRVRLPHNRTEQVRALAATAPWALVGADNIRQLAALEIVAS